MIDNVLGRIDARRGEILEGLKQFLAIPSVSTRPENAGDTARCAQWLADELGKIGLSARVAPTAGHPVVVAKNQHVAGRPTVLFYGHYDVQPAEPLDQWKSPPFEPVVRPDDNGYDAVFARGAVDDKGQVWAHVEAIRSWQEQGGLPVNLVMLIEGEEEIGSLHLAQFVKENAAELKADVALVSDTSQFSRGMPAITYGLRGLVYMEVTVTGPSQDVHSGLYGGTIANPANVLCELLGSLHDHDGRVAIPGFYDNVRELSDEERRMWAALPFSDESHRQEAGVIATFGEKGFTTLERKWARPTCDINGLTSGYQGPGAKTILPGSASAKVSMRLVPDQEPARIEAAFRRVLELRCPRTVRLDVHCHSMAAPALLPIESPAMDKARRAVETGFGTKPVLMREGGTIPVGTLFKSVLGIDTLFVGFGLSDDRVHGPNEKFDLDALHKGTRTAAALYGELAK